LKAVSFVTPLAHSGLSLRSALTTCPVAGSRSRAFDRTPQARDRGVAQICCVPLQKKFSVFRFQTSIQPSLVQLITLLDLMIVRDFLPCKNKEALAFLFQKTNCSLPSRGARDGSTRIAVGRRKVSCLRGSP